jgi:hypothetical protein
LELILINIISNVFFLIRLFELNFWRAFLWRRINICLRLKILILVDASHFVNRTRIFSLRRLSILMNSFRAARIHNWSWNHVIDAIIFRVIATLNWIVICIFIVCNNHFSAHWAHNWWWIRNWSNFQRLDPESACVFVSLRLILSVALV